MPVRAVRHPVTGKVVGWQRGGRLYKDGGVDRKPVPPADDEAKIAKKIYGGEKP